MKVLLIYPNIPLQFNLAHNIAILSACLKELGHEVKLFDTTLYKTSDVSDDEKRVEHFQIKPFEIIGLKKTDAFKDFNKIVNEFKPDMLMISFVDNTVDLGIKLLRSLREHIYTVAGGVSVILNPERFKKYKEIDLVWDKEAEKYILNIDTVDINKTPIEDFTIFSEERLRRPVDGKTYTSIPINLDRGCPYECTYCCAPSLKREYGKGYYRQKSLERIDKELEYQVRLHNPNFIFFTTETILAMPIRKLRKLSTIYKKYNIPFWCQTRVETVTDEKVQILKDMGCYRIAIGIESGNEEYRLNMLKKRFTNEEALEAFKIIKKYNIKATSNNIIGFPDETRDMIFDTINLNRKIYKIMGKMQVNGFIFQPYYGTELRRYCEEKGYIKGELDTVQGDSIIYNPYISNDELKGLMKVFTLYVKMPKSYFNRIKQAETDTSIFNELREEYWVNYDQ